jgi:hypothetical protein
MTSHIWTFSHAPPWCRFCKPGLFCSHAPPTVRGFHLATPQSTQRSYQRPPASCPAPSRPAPPRPAPQPGLLCGSVLRLPAGYRSLTGQLSTCRVALPPLRVKRTTWYLPSLTMALGSSMVMSSVPTLKITPTVPWSWGQGGRGQRQGGSQLLTPCRTSTCSHHRPDSAAF